jgi:hypothetical protein
MTAMIRALAIGALAAAACGDNDHGGDPTPPPLRLIYTAPRAGALQLVQSARSAPAAIVLDLVVGDAPLTGYSIGFDLPIDTRKVKLAAFTPGTALDPGDAPRAAAAVIGDAGPLRGMLVVGLSQKASGTGAVATDAQLAPGAVLLSVEIDLPVLPEAGVVFDGTAPGFRLPSGGLRNRAGATVVDASQLRIGKLEVGR